MTSAKRDVALSAEFSPQKIILVFVQRRQLIGWNMEQRLSDIERLREFVPRGDQRAFAVIARRHLDLVYATALRKVQDPGAAEEIAQNVFTALARKAWQLAPEDSLPAWLQRS